MTECCRYCGSANVVIIPRRIGDHLHQQRQCVDCGRGLGFVKRPWDSERARSFRIPFGKFAGLTIGELAETAAGQAYLRWIAEKVEGNAGMAARIVLGLEAPQEVEA